MTKFKNESRPRDPQSHRDYGFDHAPALMVYWGKLLQMVISQAGSKLLGGSFHDSECGIYKSEGGCYIHNAGELCLLDSICYFDRWRGDRTNTGTKGPEEGERKMAALITNIVLNWDPEDPVDSMIAAGAKHIECDTKEFVSALQKSTAGGVFGGNPLSSFFDQNPFHFTKPENGDEYRRFCMVKISGKAEKDVDRVFSDERLAEDLHVALLEYAKKQGYSIHACEPRRTNEGVLRFFINTGHGTNIDYWRTEEELRGFIKNNTKIEKVRP